MLAQTYAKLSTCPRKIGTAAKLTRAFLIAAFASWKSSLESGFAPSGLPRKFVVGFSCLILIAIGSISGIWAYNGRAALTVSDKLTLATLAIAFFAAALALLAYQVSTGTPNLQLGIMLLKQKDPYEYKLEYPTDSKRWEQLKRWFEFEPESSTPLNEDLKDLPDPIGLATQHILGEQ